MSVTVACVFSKGPTYNRSHVDRLEGMVALHMSQPYKFVCIDDSPFPGWWAKISLFEPGRFRGRVLYLDLDTTVIGSLYDLVNYPYPFCAIRDYQYSLQINSSVMAFDAGVADSVYEDFTPDVMDRLHGDQNWIHEKVSDATAFPKRWCPSYKAHVLPTGKVPKDARVIVYHGQPKPWELD
jgi:hypothetical protein